MEETERTKRILDILSATYPEARPGLHYKSPFELLIATILSAQCTDKRVNEVISPLFRDYPNAAALAGLDQQTLEEYIHSCGVYKNKARNILATCRILVDKYSGRVPETMEELTQLPGVGRKTANVVLSQAFGADAIAVDTHVFRVSNRLGLAHAADVGKTEEQLREKIPRKFWSVAHLWLITHGRTVCIARKPRCEVCPLSGVCEYFLSRKNG